MNADSAQAAARHVATVCELTVSWVCGRSTWQLLLILVLLVLGASVDSVIVMERSAVNFHYTDVELMSVQQGIFGFGGELRGLRIVGFQGWICAGVGLNLLVREEL